MWSCLGNGCPKTMILKFQTGFWNPTSFGKWGLVWKIVVSDATFCVIANHRGMYRDTCWHCVIRSRLTPDSGLDLFGGPDLLGSTHRFRSRYVVPDPTDLHWHTYGVILETWFWLVNAGECPQHYVPYKEIGITQQECSLLPRHLRTQPMFAHTMLRDTLLRFCFWPRITHGVRWWQFP